MHFFDTYDRRTEGQTDSYQLKMMRRLYVVDNMGVILMEVSNAIHPTSLTAAWLCMDFESVVSFRICVNRLNLMHLNLNLLPFDDT